MGSYIQQFLKSNAVWIIGIIFTGIGVYFQVDSNTKEITKLKTAYQEDIEDLEAELKVVEERLRKKINVINDHEDDLHEIDKRVVVLETTECH